MHLNWLASLNWLLMCVFVIGEHPIQKKPNHAIYLSLTDIEIVEGEAKLKVKVFSDDLRDALKNYQSTEYKPADLQNFFSLNQDLANEYFRAHFQIRVENVQADLLIKGFSIEGDAHFINFSCALPQNFKDITVKADFLMELFPTQTNVVKLKNGAQTQYLKFNMPVVPQTLNF